jgi:hypothetical protein
MRTRGFDVFGFLLGESSSRCSASIVSRVKGRLRRLLRQLIVAVVWTVIAAVAGLVGSAK